MSAQPLRKALSPQFSNDFIFVAQNGIIFMELTVETGKSYTVRYALVFLEISWADLYLCFICSLWNKVDSSTKKSKKKNKGNDYAWFLEVRTFMLVSLQKQVRQFKEILIDIITKIWCLKTELFANHGWLLLQEHLHVFIILQFVNIALIYKT